MVIGAGLLLSAAGSIYSGISSFNSSKRVASDLRFQGQIMYQEALRTANIIEEEGVKFSAQQSLQYIGSGVQIAGSALVTITQTRKYAETEANATRAKGGAQKTLADRKASNTENEGRASLVSGIMGGAGSIFSGAE